MQHAWQRELYNKIQPENLKRRDQMEDQLMDDIKFIFGEIVYEGANWIHTFQRQVQRQAFVNTEEFVH